MKENRRDFIIKSTALAALSVAGLSGCSESRSKENEKRAGLKSVGATSQVEWPVTFGEGMPKLCVLADRDASLAEMRKLKQLGVDYVLVNGPKMPWTEKGLREIMDRFKPEGLTVINMMIGGFPNTVYGREGRDEEIKLLQDSIRAAGVAGLPVIEYNFYAHRLMEGYYEVKARGGAGTTAFDYERGKDAPHDPALGTPQTAESLWNNLTYLVKAIIPVAEKAGVRMAMHPNDPPIPVSHGHAQILATFNDWKRLLAIVDSPANGMTYDCGVVRELGEDPIEVLRYMGARDRINHMHYRNVTVEKPYVKYQEVFFDEGQVNLFAVMQEVFQQGYQFGLYPEHPRELDYDREHTGGTVMQPGGIKYPGGGGYAAQAYNVAYAKAMMQAVVSANGTGAKV
ncbi:mannonate dehydratase [Adhaeribacter aquaticus]|uniref:mannonate dehydratase n=1 Tax=Adhaeribacter aquaticus TaxID=299567 RepID=UPI000425FB1C|nr:mannonate dehydratase [Adhaeribacter aquaticus]